MPDFTAIRLAADAAEHAHFLRVAYLETKLAASESDLFALDVAYRDLKAAYDNLLSPSGEPIPTADLPGWKLAWREDFDTDCPEGGFRTTYPNVGLYPPRVGQVWHDTSKRGLYDPNILSVSGSVLRKRIHTSPDGVHHVAAILPKLSDVGTFGAVSGGRFAVRFRSDTIPTYKIAWLLWPLSETWPRDGEIDFPECSLSGDVIQGFMHRQGATLGSDQSWARGTVGPQDWHTCVIEWRMGESCTFILDGVQIGTTQTWRVPATPMRWTLQTETSLNKTVPVDKSATGNVEIDWLCYWAPA